jgi:DNA-binding PucR family transcriptional regulator
LRATVSVALDYGIQALARSEERPLALPTALLAQARLAARNGVKLETVLRRYLAGYTLLGDFLIEESSKDGALNRDSLKLLLRAQASVFDRVMAAVSEEYAREEHGRLGSAEQRRAERVRRLLEGELVDAAELRYDFSAHHLAAIAAGPGAQEALRELAKALDCRPLLVPREEGTVWAWLGSRKRTEPEDVEHLIAATWPAGVTLALGEPGEGMGGWRLTHRQARAALPIALRRPEPVVRYADVALLASMLEDELLATSLRQLYLAPLAQERDGGQALRKTLRAYFEAERNVSSAAAALGVNRQTVVNRLRAIEERFERPLNSCAAEVEAALDLEDLGYPLLPHAAFSHG